jgi:hypothetical protein
MKNDQLKQYQNLVWDNIEFLDVFNIKEVLRSENSRVDSLVVSTSLLLLHLEFDQR